MRLALFHAATIPAPRPRAGSGVVESKRGGWFIAPGPAGRPLLEALAERVSTFYADDAAAERALRAKQADYDAAGEAAASAPRPYLCTVALRMPADDGDSLRPEEVTEWLSEHGATVLEWHDEDLIGAAEREEDRAERRALAHRLVELGAEAHRLAGSLAGSPETRGRIEVAGQELGLAAHELLPSEARSC